MQLTGGNMLSDHRLWLQILSRSVNFMAEDSRSLRLHKIHNYTSYYTLQYILFGITSCCRISENSGIFNSSFKSVLLNGKNNV